MSQLVGLNVKTVAFVHRGANRKKFFLTKSTDATNSGKTEGEKVNKVIKTALQALMKSDAHKESTTDQLLEALKADEAVKKLELSEDDFKEVKADIEFFKSMSDPATPADPVDPAAGDDPADPADPEPKSAADKDKVISDLQKSVSTLTDRLEKTEKSRRIGDIEKFLRTKAPYAPIDVKKEAELIFALEKTNPNAAKNQLEQHERVSTLLKDSDVLDEVGSALPGNESLLPSQELIAEITKAREDLVTKSDKAVTPEDEIAMISRIVKSKGSTFYDQYVADHRRVSRGGQNMHMVE